MIVNVLSDLTSHPLLGGERKSWIIIIIIIKETDTIPSNII